MAINLAHKSITIDVNDRNAPNVVGIVNVNDKATRYLDVTLTASGKKLTFADCTVTATFATDGYLISDSVACTLNSTADVITVPLENFNSTSGFLAIEIKIANGETQVLNTPLTLKVKVTPSLAENSKINTESFGSFADISREVATARGSSNSLGIRLDTVDTNLAKKANKSDVDSINSRLQSTEATLNSKANIADVSNSLASKADKSTTLAGYGITDAYTKEDVQKKLNKKLDSMPFDSEPKNNSPCYLTSGAVYNALLAKADVTSVYSKTEADNLLVTKADKAEVDTALTNKANLVNSSNIFDFDTWAKELQKLNPPVYHGTLDELNFDEKSITITPTEKDTYTNSWMLPKAESMKIGVKPNTKYWVYWLTNNYNCNVLVYLNGINTEATRVSIKGGKGAFVTNNDTSFITLRFGNYQNSAFKVSKIMITEKESIYLPNKVAEGVPEVADEVLTFEKTTQTSLDGKYDSSNIELGTATLTPYSTQIDKIKSATCLYEKIGDIVIVNVTVIMNETSLGGTSSIALLNMPFSNKSDVITYDIGISKNGGMFRGSVNKSAWLQFTPLNKQAYNFVADEQVNFSLIYKI